MIEYQSCMSFVYLRICWIWPLFVIALSACAPSIQHAGGGGSDSLIASGQYKAAEQQYNQEIKKNPQSQSALIGLALALIGLENLNEAEKNIAKAKAIGESNELTYAIALLLTRQGHGDKAIPFCQSLLRDMPDAAVSHLCLGMALRQAGQYNEAISSLNTALSIEPLLIDATIELALAKDANEQRIAAINVLKRAIRHNAAEISQQNLAQLQVNLGKLYEKSRRYTEANYMFDKARLYDATNIEAIAGSGRTLRLLGRLDDALSILKPAVRQYKQDARVHAELATVYRDYHLMPQALAEAKQALKLDTTSSECYQLLVSTLDPANDSDSENLRLLDQAAAILTDDFELQNRLGEASIKRKRWKTAIEAFRRAIMIKPTDAQTNYGLGLAQLNGGDIAGAKNAVVALEQLDAQKAKELLEKINTIAPEPKTADNAFVDVLNPNNNVIAEKTKDNASTKKKAKKRLKSKKKAKKKNSRTNKAKSKNRKRPRR
ncbi:MAG: tetratricopeptide repeat protein [Deltaproteobacteria bacterium]|nr:tetratricopeptide repeat protein [Deltaproteobacteria bacterium]